MGMVGGFLVTLKAYLSFEDSLTYIFPFIMTVLFSFYYYLYQKGTNVSLLAFLTLSTLYIELLIKEQYTAIGLGIYFWIYMFPLAIFAFFTPLKSLLLSTTFLVIFLFIHKHGASEINQDYFLFPLALSYFTITLFNYIYQRFQHKQAQEIEEKTLALNQINFSLEQRIKKAVQESKEKDKMLQQQAKLAQMGELLSMISHQWRQPLGAISIASISIKTELAFEKYDLANKDEKEAFLTFLSQKLDKIESYTNSLSHTIDDFRNFYNPNKEIIKSDVVQSVTKALDIMQSSLHQDHIVIKKLYHGSCIIEHYPNEMMQVILNILNNAHNNFLEKKIQNPEITIMIAERETYITIAISDNGGGIEEHILEKIFDPYFSTKADKNGTGLGLYMSKIIIEEHHKGLLTAKNQNGGVTFSIRLPKSQNTRQQDDAPPMLKSSAQDASDKFLQAPHQTPQV